MSQTASHLAGAAIGADPVPPRPSRATRRATGFGDTIFAALCQGAGILVLLLLGAIIVELFLGGLPAFRAFGLAFVAKPGELLETKVAGTALQEMQLAGQLWPGLRRQPHDDRFHLIQEQLEDQAELVVADLASQFTDAVPVQHGSTFSRITGTE